MSWLIKKFISFDDKIAIIYRDTSYTYKQLFNNIEKNKKDIIKDKILQGEVVYILGDYSFSNISLLLALYQNKNIIGPITTIIENETKDRIEESFTSKSISIKDNGFTIKKYIVIQIHQMIKI